jgi:DNA-binding CsgD family transcriptional regulator
LAGLDIDRLTVVSNRLGEAVLDPAMWPSLMDDICRAVSTAGAGLLQSDIRTADIPTTASASEIFKSYFDNQLHVSDVRALRGVPLLLAGSPVVADQDLFASERDMLRDPLYADLGRLGYRWWAAIGFRAGTALWGLALQRTKQEGQFQAPELAALGGLSRRLTETATLSKAVGRLVLTGMTNALDLVNQPAVSLDRLGFVIDANPRATGVFDDEIRVRNRRLFVRDKAARSALDVLIDHLRHTPDTEALPASPIVVRRETRSAVVIRVLPVDGAARSPFLGARAVLTLSEIGATPNPQRALILRAFGLTPAEARLADLLGTGMSLEAAAEELAVTRETVRNQLKAVFAKTRTHRQGELVALLSRL